VAGVWPTPQPITTNATKPGTALRHFFCTIESSRANTASA
jgi:hypothetical protein